MQKINDILRFNTKKKCPAHGIPPKIRLFFPLYLSQVSSTINRMIVICTVTFQIPRLTRTCCDNKKNGKQLALKFEMPKTNISRSLNRFRQVCFLEEKKNVNIRNGKWKATIGINSQVSLINVDRFIQHRWISILLFFPSPFRYIDAESTEYYMHRMWSG